MNILDLKEELNELKDLYAENVYPSLRERRYLLNQAKEILVKNEAKLINALSKDYGYRSDYDSMMLDILPSINYIKYVSKQIKKWMKKERRHTGMILKPSKVEVHFQPLGVVGVVVPWNFPINLAMGPAMSAIGAGNKVMVKMSEFTPNVNKVLIEAFKPLSDHIRIYEGDVEVSTKFTSLAFDHLLFTGSTNVGRIVAQAAANNLTPVTLELGGKSPTIITEYADLDHAIDNIIIGKTFNSGQICVSPDYLFIFDAYKEVFIEKFVQKVKEIHNGSHKNKLTEIINQHHFQRLHGLIKDAEEKGARIIKTKDSNDGANRIYPTLITDVHEDMKIMKEEIFGSLFPIMTYRKLDEVIDYIKARPRPLALYIMSNNTTEVNDIIMRTHSGGVSVNDTVMHVAADDAPFGGIGESGMGHYHGKEGFLTFSKSKTVLRSTSLISRNWLLMKYRDQILSFMKKVYLR